MTYRLPGELTLRLPAREPRAGEAGDPNRVLRKRTPRNQFSALGALLATLLGWAAATSGHAQCPTLNGPTVSPTQACVGDQITLTVSGGTDINATQTVDWYAGPTPGFSPPAQGTYLGSANITGSTGSTPCAPAPVLVGVLADACDGGLGANSGSEENELVVLWSGGGFNASDLGVDVNNGPDPTQQDIGTLGACALMASPTVPIVGCAQYGGPTTQVPPNAIVIVYTSSLANLALDVTLACALGLDVYVFQSSCSRQLSPGTNIFGAFSDAGGTYAVEAGCGSMPINYGPAVGAAGNNSTTAGWAIAGSIPAAVPCGQGPALPSFPPVGGTASVDPLTYTLTAAECGTQYIRAVVNPTPSTCPSSATTAVQLDVSCPTATISGTGTFCAGDPSNSTQITFTGTGPWTFGYEITGPTGGTNVVNPVTTSTSPYTVTTSQSTPGTYTVQLLGVSAAGCSGMVNGTATFDIVAAGPAQPLDGTVCILDLPYDLTQLDDPANPGGTWSGPGVSANQYVGTPPFPNPGVFTLTYTPPTGASCVTAGTADLTVTATQPFSVGSIPDQCATGTAFDVRPYITPALTGSWTGTFVVGPGQVNPPVGFVGLATLDFEPDGCYSPFSVGVNYVAAQSANPGDATICASQQPFDLTTLEDPAYPGGTWSGPGVVGGSAFNAGPAASGPYTLTYTPPASVACVSAGQATLTVSSGAPVQPLDAAICSADQPLDLTPLEDPGYPGGTWAGPGVSGSSFNAGASASGTYSLTYTPPAGSGCATAGSATVTVTPSQAAQPDDATFCASAQPFDLTSLEDPSYPGGDWTGSFVTGSTFDAGPTASGTYSVTYLPPATASCVLPGIATLTVGSAAAAQPIDATICATQQPYDLSALEDPAAPGGTWSGPQVAGGSFDAGLGASGTYTVTYTPPTGSGCLSAGQATITVSATAAAQPADATICAAQQPYDLTSLEDPAYPGGTWSGSNLTGAQFDAGAAASGSYTLTYTPPPSAGPCVQAGTSIVTVNSSVPSNPLSVSICTAEQPYDLTQLEDPLFPGGTWTGAQVVGTNFDAGASGVGVYSVTYTPPAGSGCAGDGVAQVTVRPTTAAQPLDAAICVGQQPLDLSAYEDPAAPGGSWSGAGVAGGIFDAGAGASGAYVLTYTPPAGVICLTAGTMTVQVAADVPTAPRSRSICAAEQPFDLTSLEDPAYPGGTWSGPGVAGGLFDAGASAAGPYSLSYAPPAGTTCVSAGTATLTVVANASAQPLDRSICPADQPFDLRSLEDPNYPGGTWSGTGVTGTFFDAGAGASGPYVLTYTPPASAACIGPATATLTVTSSAPAAPLDASICATEQPFDLSALADPAAPGGSWSGAFIAGSTFDAGASASGAYSVTYTPPTGSGCYVAGTADITVQQPSTVGLDVATVCASGGPLDLNTLFSVAPVAGQWSGTGVSGATFDPSGLAQGVYTMTFTPSTGACALATQTTVTVTDAVQPSIAPISACAADLPVALAGFEDPSYPGGTWRDASGAVVVNLTDFTGGAGGLTTFTYEPVGGGCAQPVAVSVTVSAVVTASLPLDTVCAADGPVDLAVLLRPSGATGAWTGGGVSGAGVLAPSLGTPGRLQVTWTPDAGQCFGQSAYTFEVVPVSPLAAGPPSFVCAPDGLTYTATVDLTFSTNNGTIATDLGALSGTMLVVAGLTSGVTASAAVGDAATCTPDLLVDLTHTCPPANCTTNAGALNAGPFELCVGDVLAQNATTGAVDDGNDVLVYVLDDDLDPANGYLAVGPTSAFGAPAGALDQLLYLYAWSGDSDGAGAVDLNDACADVSDAARVRWSDTATLVVGAPACESDGRFRVSVDLVGGLAPFTPVAPLTGTFSPDGRTFTSDLQAAGSTLTLAFAGASGCVSASEQVTGNCSSGCNPGDPGTFAANDVLLCDAYVAEVAYNGDAALNAGDVQVFYVYLDALGTVELGRFSSLPIDFSTFGGPGTLVYVASVVGPSDGAGGVDPACRNSSIIVGVNLGETFVLPPIDSVACPGSTVTIGGVAFTQSNPSGTVVFPGNGVCDTSVAVTVSFTGTDRTVTVDDLLCFDGSFSVGGETFDRSRPAGTVVVPDGQCFVTYVVDLAFRPSGDTLIAETLCPGASLRAGSVTWDQTNPSGQVNLRGRLACDSLITVQLSFFPVADSLLRDTICRGETFFVGNQAFDETRPTGRAILQSSIGCDSIVDVELAFRDTPTFTLTGDPELCSPDLIEVTFSNPSGRVLEGNASINGSSVGTITIPPGTSRQTFPPSPDFALVVGSVAATQGQCAEAIPSSASYRPRLSLLDATVPLPLSGAYVACGENTVATIGVDPGPGLAPYSYRWSTGDTASFISDVARGTYAVEVTDALGCVSADTFEVTDADTIGYDAALADPLCEEGLGSITIDLDELPPGLRYRFDLPGLQAVTDRRLVFDDLEEGTYVFQLIQDNGCEQNELLELVDPPALNLLKEDTLGIELGDSLTLRVDLPPEAMGVRWLPGTYLSCDTCATTQARPTGDIGYTVEVTTDSDCLLTDEIFLRIAPVADVFIPTAFSPNGDLVNDLLVPEGGPEVERILEFRVFDRWGEQMFSASDFAAGDREFGWDGHHRGRVMNPGVFVAYVRARFIDGRERVFTGDVTLVR